MDISGGLEAGEKDQGLAKTVDHQYGQYRLCARLDLRTGRYGGLCQLLLFGYGVGYALSCKEHHRVLL